MTYQQSLELRVSPSDLRLVWEIGLAWKNHVEVFLQVTVERISRLVFPLVQLRSRLKEIFGGGRGDRYCFSYNFSPVFNHSALTMKFAGSVP